MSNNSYRINPDLVLKPQSGTTVSEEGEIAYRDDVKKIEVSDGSAADLLVQEAKAATLTNKTMDFTSNTITNIPHTALTGITNTEISNSAAIAYSKLALTGSVLNADLAGSIAYSKLSLSGAILNGDLAGSIADSKLSTISTASKVANSATTAASANTPSAIVARDGSGNFSAGTITASLTGSVTGTASGNTTYSANNHGVVLSSATNAMTVIAPDSSTNKILTSAGASANPTWKLPATSNYGSAVITSNSLWTVNSRTLNNFANGGSVNFTPSGSITLTTNIEGISFTPDSSSSLYMVTVSSDFNLQHAGDSAEISMVGGVSLQLSMTSTAIATPTSSYVPFSLTGIITPGSTSTCYINLLATSQAGVVGLCNFGTGGTGYSSINWTVIKLA